MTSLSSSTIENLMQLIPENADVLAEREDMIVYVHNGNIRYVRAHPEDVSEPPKKKRKLNNAKKTLSRVN